MDSNASSGSWTVSDSYLVLIFLDAKHKYNMWTDGVVMSGTPFHFGGESVGYAKPPPIFLFFCVYFTESLYFIVFQFSTIEFMMRVHVS